MILLNCIDNWQHDTFKVTKQSLLQKGIKFPSQYKKHNGNINEEEADFYDEDEDQPEADDKMSSQRVRSHNSSSRSKKRSRSKSIVRLDDDKRSVISRL